MTKEIDRTFSETFENLRVSFENLKIACVGAKDAVLKFDKNHRLLAVKYPKKQHPFKKFFKR